MRRRRKMRDREGAYCKQTGVKKRAVLLRGRDKQVKVVVVVEETRRKIERACVAYMCTCCRMVTVKI
jgi:hypothetical protein